MLVRCGVVGHGVFEGLVWWWFWALWCWVYLCFVIWGGFEGFANCGFGFCRFWVLDCM